MLTEFAKCRKSYFPAMSLNLSETQFALNPFRGTHLGSNFLQLFVAIYFIPTFVSLHLLEPEQPLHLPIQIHGQAAPSSAWKHKVSGSTFDADVLLNYSCSSHKMKQALVNSPPFGSVLLSLELALLEGVIKHLFLPTKLILVRGSLEKRTEGGEGGGGGSYGNSASAIPSFH